MIQPAVILLLASLSGSPAGEIVCETRRVPVIFAEGRARKHYILEYETRCYHPPVGHLQQLKLACDLLHSAYGSEEGQARCKELVSRSAPPELGP